MSTAGKGLDGPGMQAAKVARPGWGKGLAGVRTQCWPSEEPERSSHGQAGAGMPRFLGAKEALTTSCCCCNSWLPKGRDRGCQAKKACCSCPHPGAALCRCLDLAWAASHPHSSSCPLYGDLSCPGYGQTPFPKLPRHTVPNQAAPDRGV